MHETMRISLHGNGFWLISIEPLSLIPTKITNYIKITKFQATSSMDLPSSGTNVLNIV